MILSLLVSGALAQEVNGFVELRASAFTGVEADVPVLVVERFRPTFTAPLGDHFELSTTVEAGLSQGWRSNNAAVDLVQDAGVDPDLLQAFNSSHNNEFFGVSQAADYLAVDRLTLDVYTDPVDLTIGRQAMNWGSGFVINPSDPFPEVLLTEPWKPRSGVNAIKAVVPFGEMNTLQLVAASDDTFQHPRLAGRVTVNALQADWSLVGAWREEADEGVVGVDIKGTLALGYWVEGVLHLREDEVFEELVVGLDYSLPVLEQLVVTVQYYRNGSGSTGTSTGLAMLEPRKPFSPSFGSRDYVMGAVSAGLTPDVSASALWMQNLHDGTAFFVPTVSIVATAAIDISAAAQLPIDVDGGGGEFRPGPDQLVIGLPDSDGQPVPVDFNAIVPSATFIVWTRFNF